MCSIIVLGSRDHRAEAKEQVENRVRTMLAESVLDRRDVKNDHFTS